MSTSHSIKLLTCWLVILLNFQPVDYSLYWTSDLSTSHSIERPTCRPVIVLNCRIVDQSLYILVDPSTSDSNDFRLIDQWHWSFYLSSSRSHYHMTKYADKSDKSFYWLINCWLFRLLDYRHVNKSIQWPIHRESVTLLSTTRPTCIYIISRRF